MSHIFISYSRNDIEFCRNLRAVLEQNGLEVWMDEKGLQAGVDWWDEIERNIDTCAAFILVMSQSSKESPFVKAELYRAMNQKKRIFPILLNGTGFSILSWLQHENVTNQGQVSAKFIATLRSSVNAGGKVEEELNKEIWGDTVKTLEPLLAGNNTNDYIPAAVMLGVTLERGLRILCNRNAILTENDNGKPKFMLQMLDDLREKKVINRVEYQQLKTYIEVRNYAAHGMFDDIKRDDVTMMFNGLKSFFEHHLK